MYPHPSNICILWLDSGHGGQTKDRDGDEDDGYDEGGCPPYLYLNITYVLNYRPIVIYPVDFETNSHIVDDLMHEIMVKPLPPGCRMTAIFDVSVFGAQIYCSKRKANFRDCVVLSFRIRSRCVSLTQLQPVIILIE